MNHRFLAAALGAAGLSLAAGASANTLSVLTVGTTVRDTQGAAVGTIDSLSAGSAVIATGSHKVALPLTSFGKDAKGPVIAISRAELDAAAEKAAANSSAAVRAQMLPGVVVYGSQGLNIGTIKAIEGEHVVVATARGDAKLPISAIGAGVKGLTVNMSAADFQAAIADNS